MADAATLEAALAYRKQKHQISIFGMWVFLATEVMFFGGMIGAYVIYHIMYAKTFAEASHHMNVTLGATNTFVLLTSSFLMALGVHAAETGNKKALIRYLLGTVFLGLVFLVIKGTEYHEHIAHHLFPNQNFHYEGANPHIARIYFSFYFAMTGLHMLHVIIGVCLLSVMAVLSARDKFNAEYYTPIEVSGLYWHLVDIIWIFLFPLIYLIGQHG